MEMEIYHQRMEAVKRAYADVILNTGKEAAARVMASERRALRAEKELSNSKDQSLAMIFRLKQLLDAKTKEANEAASKLSIQEGLIGVLEAKLNEAGQITVDLREKLQQVQHELCKANHKLYLNDELLKDVMMYRERTREIVIASDLDRVYCSDQGLDDLTSRNVERVDHESVPETIRHRTPDQYKNGCTQRVRALETSPQKNQSLYVEDEDNDAGKRILTPRENPSADTTNPNSESMTQHNGRIIHNSPLAKVNSRRKRKSRYGAPKRHTTKSCPPNMITNLNEAVDISNGSNKENILHVADGHEDEECGKRRTKYRDTLTTSLKSPPCQLYETYPQSSVLAHCNGNRIAKCGAEIKNREIVSEAELHSAVSSSGEAEGNSLLKNTSERKRKMVTYNSPVVGKLEKSFFKRRAVEKERVPVASERALAREDRRLMQVAHQLVSLSKLRK